MYNLDLEKAEEPEIKCQYLLDHQKSKMFQKNIYFCCIDYAKAFDWVDHNKLWKILKEMGIPDHLSCLLRNLCVGQKDTEPDMEQQASLKWERSMSRLHIVTLLV